MKEFNFILKSFFQRLSTMPPNVPSRYYRWFVLSNYALLFTLIFHGILLIVFGWIGISNLAFFNVASVAIYLTCLVINIKGWFKTVFMLAFVEVIAHQVLCSLTLGWDSGFHYYILAITALIFLTPWKGNAYKIILIVISFIFYLALYYYLKSNAPIAMLNESMQNIFICCNVIGIYILLSVFAFYYNYAAVNAENALEKEHQKSEDLLHNILPAPIASKLKITTSAIADNFKHSTILFADIVGFTPLSEQIPPEELVKLLNEIFSEFDQLTDKHRLEKIKTIGDAYMVAAGIPEYRDDHAEAIAEMALDMMESIDAVNKKLNRRFEIRIGINVSLRQR